MFGLTNRVAGKFSGTVRFSSGDAYCLTFADASLAMAAAERPGQRGVADESPPPPRDLTTPAFRAMKASNPRRPTGRFRGLPLKGEDHVLH